jgi:hypothetical protein
MGYTPANDELISQVAANPTGATADQISGFQGQLNNTYSGPTNWADMGTQQGKVNEAQQYGSLASTPGGLNVLTQEFEGPQASQGVNQLDTLLLGGSPEAMGQVKAAADPFSTLTDYLNSQNTNVQGAITGGQNAANTISQNALNAFTGANGTLTNLNNTVNQTAADRLAAAQAQQAQLTKDIGGLYNRPVDTSDSGNIALYGGKSMPWYNTTNYNVGDLAPQDLAAMGLSQDQWNSLKGAMTDLGTTQGYTTGGQYGVQSPTAQADLSTWLNFQDPTQSIAPGTVATPEQYAQMSAIQNLLGSKMPQEMAINPLNASQAGTAPQNAQTFDYATALQQIQQADQQAEQMAQQQTAANRASADAAHAAEKHSGTWNSIKNAISHPLTLNAVLANPMSWLPNTKRVLEGQTINPKDISSPGAKVAAPIAGAVIGGIYGGPAGAAAGSTVGGALGGPLETLGGQANKPYAHGGEVQDVSTYLDKKHDKAEVK